MFSKSTVLYALPLLAVTASAVPTFQFPAFPHLGGGSVKTSDEGIDMRKYTIGQILNYTLHHRGPHHEDEHDHPRGPPLYKLAYIVNRTESIKEYLSDPDISVTLFAPDDAALTPPGRGDHGHGHEHGPGHGHEHEHSLFSKFLGQTESNQDDESAAPRHHPFHLMTEEYGGDDHHHEPTDEEKRRFIKKLIEAVLHYHISSSEISKDELKDKQTIPTTLNQTKDTDVPFRIRSETKLSLFPPPPSYDVKLNFYAALRKIPTIKAKNGVIHLISAPLLPPLTPLDQLLTFPIPFSTLTSGIQQTELDSALAPWLHHRKGDFDDFGLSGLINTEDDQSSIVMSVLKELAEEAIAQLPSSGEYEAFPFTIFAPTNLAFAKVPFKIRTFLFSPFGRPILKKLLSFHVVPQYVLHSDYHLNATRDSKVVSLANPESVRLPSNILDVPSASSLGDVSELGGLPVLHGGEAEVERYNLPTILGSRKNESLAVNVYTYRKAMGKGPLTKTISVGNHEQSEEDYTQVWIADGVAWGGAVHAINSLIRPIMPKHDHDHEHGPHHGPHHGHDHGHGGNVEYFKSLWA